MALDLHARMQSVPSFSAPRQVRDDVSLYIPRNRGGRRQVRVASKN